MSRSAILSLMAPLLAVAAAGPNPVLGNEIPSSFQDTIIYPQRGLPDDKVKQQTDAADPQELLLRQLGARQNASDLRGKVLDVKIEDAPH